MNNQYHIAGAILATLGGNHHEEIARFGLEKTHPLADHPRVAIVRTTKPITEEQLQDFHRRHRNDVDKKGIPYFFLVKDVTTGAECIWYSDEKTPRAYNSPAEKEAALKAGRDKGVDFTGDHPDEYKFAA